MDNYDRVSVDIPSEFHGTWQSTVADPQTGLRDILTISQDDMISGSSLVSGMNHLLETYKKEADDRDLNFDVDFSQSNQVYGRYSYTMIVTVGINSMVQSFTLSIDDNDILTMVSDIVSDGTNIQHLQGTYEKI